MDSAVSVYDDLSKVPSAPGKYMVRLPVTTDMNGMDVVIWVHVLMGKREGPTLTVLSGLHGNEWGHLTFFERLVRDFEPDRVAGRLLVIPMANAVAFGTLSRYVRDDSDNADANRSFPGPGRRFTWLAEQIATVLADQVFTPSDALIDFHLGIWGSVMGSTIAGTDYSRPEVNERSFALALAFGAPLIFAARMLTAWPGPRTSSTYAGEVLGIPCFGSFLGGAGFDRDLEETWHVGNLNGIYNVMRYLGMMTGELVLPVKYLIYETVQRVNPRVGGFLEPTNPVERFGREVRKGELLGRVISPFTFAVLEELRAPVEGYLSFWARSYPVRPGDWAFGVVPADHSGTRWMPQPDRL